MCINCEIATVRRQNEQLKHEVESVKKQLSNSMRKGDARAKVIVGLLDKQAGLRHEIRRLEDLLAWAAVTTASDYREVIKRGVPRAHARAERALNPEPPDPCADAGLGPYT